MYHVPCVLPIKHKERHRREKASLDVAKLACFIYILHDILIFQLDIGQVFWFSFLPFHLERLYMFGFLYILNVHHQNNLPQSRNCCWNRLFNTPF